MMASILLIVVTVTRQLLAANGTSFEKMVILGEKTCCFEAGRDQSGWLNRAQTLALGGSGNVYSSPCTMLAS